MRRKNIILLSSIAYLLFFVCGVCAQEPQVDSNTQEAPNEAETVSPQVPPTVLPPEGKLTTPIVNTEETKKEIKKIDEETAQNLSARELALIDQEMESEIELNFNNASLQNIVDQIGQLFNLTFISDDMVVKAGVSQKTLRDAEAKVSFTTNKPLSKRKAWSLFTTFLELAGWSLTATADARTYRITETKNAQFCPLPTYINTSLDVLPKTDQRIRYVCFLENSTPDQFLGSDGLLNKIKSEKAHISAFPLLRAIIITDMAYNVYTLLQIIRELDKTSSAQVLSVVNLKEAEAAEVAALIKTLTSGDDTTGYRAMWGGSKKESSQFYFSKDVSVIAAPRTNSLLLIGPKEGVTRIEQFILTHIDINLTQRYEPVHIHDLNYAPAAQIKEILNSVIADFNKSETKTPDAAAREVGAVVGGLKYFGNVFIQEESENNRLIIRASAEDYQHLKQIITELDKPQTQVAIEVMILEIDLDRTRQWGIQWDTAKNRTGNAQLSGFWNNAGVQTTGAGTSAGSNNIIANLISLAKIPNAGATVFTLGKNSIYAIAGVLEQDDQTRVIANPFIVTTNKYRGSVAISQQRRIQSETVAGAGSDTKPFTNIEAKWEVSVTPQINDNGVVNLDIDIFLQEFTNTTATSTDASNANMIKRQIHTNTNVADTETIALGGILTKKKTAVEYRFPVLSRIPIIGNLFKNTKQENEQKTLVVLMSPTILRPSDELANDFTKNKAQNTSSVAGFTTERHERNRRDPIYNWFFKATDDDVAGDIKKFVNRKRPITTQEPPLKSETAHAITQSIIKSEEGGFNA